MECAFLSGGSWYFASSDGRPYLALIPKMNVRVFNHLDNGLFAMRRGELFLR